MSHDTTRSVALLAWIVLSGCFADSEGVRDHELGTNASALLAPQPDLTMNTLVQNNTTLPHCGKGFVSVTLDELNIGRAGVGSFASHLLNGGVLAAPALARPPLAGSSSRSVTLTFAPYLGPCDSAPPCVPGGRKSFDVYIDGGDLYRESNEQNNLLGTLDYTIVCNAPAVEDTDTATPNL
jgi:hypothetical protein